MRSTTTTSTSTPTPPIPIIKHAPSIAAQTPESFPDPTEGGTVSWKTILSAPQTLSDSLTVGIATCAPGSSATSCPAGYLGLHRHAHAEVYYVISGKGVVTVDGREYGVGEGSVVFIPGDAEHGMRCVGEEEEVRWLYVFAAGGFGEIVYRFGERAKL